MLPDGTIVKKVWTDVMSYTKPNQYLIDCSTIDVKTSKYIQNKAKKNNLFTLDAPVSGGVIGADQYSNFMVGGQVDI